MYFGKRGVTQATTLSPIESSSINGDQLFSFDWCSLLFQAHASSSSTFGDANLTSSTLKILFFLLRRSFSALLLSWISRSLFPSFDFALSRCPPCFKQKRYLMNFEVCPVYSKETYMLNILLVTRERDLG